MSVSMRSLRPYAPLVVLVVTIAAGWMVFIRPLSADQRRAAAQLAGLRQRELTLRREVGEITPHGVDVDPETTFERQVASGDATPELLEQLARLASSARARNLLIETVEGEAGPAKPGHVGEGDVTERDPRFALFDVPVSHTPIRLAFDTEYASLGRLLWAFRNLPTTVEIRTLSVGLPPADGDVAVTTRADVVRVAVTLHAYSRSAEVRLKADPASGAAPSTGVLVQASNTSRSGAIR